MSHGAVMRLPGTQGPPAPAPGDSGDSGSGDSGARPRLPPGKPRNPAAPLFPPPPAGGAPAEPPAPVRAGRRLWRAAALLPLRAAVRGLRRAPPGRCPPAMPPPGPRRLPAAAAGARLPPRTFRSYLPRSHRTYSCVHCRAHLARHEELISKSFQGSHGRAYLFNSVVNVGCGPGRAGACCSRGCTRWPTSSARAARPPWAGNT
ncbi:protein yippee-like 4 [Passer domesticus]|uniref:protein yippee-like 4 n=1 Tax=Passer domesticus TaxID=48849 RepID=UPI0030FEF194